MQWRKHQIKLQVQHCPGSCRFVGASTRCNKIADLVPVMQKSTGECINKWNNKSISVCLCLPCPTSSLKSVIFFKFNLGSHHILSTMYSFDRAAETKCYELGGVSNRNVLEGSRCQQSWLPLRAARETSMPLLAATQRSGIPWPMAAVTAVFTWHLLCAGPFS